MGSGELCGVECGAVGRQGLLQLAQKEHCLRLSSWSWRAHSGSPRGPPWLRVSPSSKANVNTLSNSFVGWTRDDWLQSHALEQEAGRAGAPVMKGESDFSCR